MKWKESDFNKNLKSVKAVLIYGPDAGQIDELSDNAISILQIDKDNLFSIDSNELKEKQDALFSESCCPSMFGGQKMVLISNAGDSDAKLIKELVEHKSLDAMVIVSSTELKAGGGLRTLFENANDLAALACYTDDVKTLSALIQKELFSVGINHIMPDAMEYMTANLGVDRGITRSFLKKIALYVDDKKKVELEDVEKCLPDTGAADIDDFLFSLTAGHIKQTMRAMDRLFYDNTAPNMLVRMLNMHFKKLLGAVVGGQMPRLFWKVADKFNRAVKIWTESEIVGVLERLNELEKQLRITGMPAEILLRDFSLKLSLRSAKLALKGIK